MKLILYLLPFYFFVSSCQAQNSEEQPLEVKKEILPEKDLKDTTSQTNSAEAQIHINREQARRYELSTVQVASEVRKLLFEKKVPIEELLDQEIELRNHRARLIKIPIRSVIDSISIK